MKPTIVVVEDDAHMNQALGRLLKVAGFEVLAFTSPEDLLASGAAGRAGCLIFDIQLPGISGFELLRRVREGGAVAPVIFITAHETEDGRQRACDVGAAGYFTKPFERKALLAAIAGSKPAA